VMVEEHDLLLMVEDDDIEEQREVVVACTAMVERCALLLRAVANGVAVD
jgi:hypothetical protein